MEQQVFSDLAIESIFVEIENVEKVLEKKDEKYNKYLVTMNSGEQYWIMICKK